MSTLLETIAPDSVLNTKNYKISSPEGMVDFLGVNKITQDKYLSLIFTDGSTLKCSLNHPLMTISGIVKAKNLTKYDEVNTKTGGCFLKSRKLINKSIDLFDIINSGKSHLYYSNGLISHNCSFIGSANTLIEAEKLNVMAYGKAKQKNGEGLAIYEEPVKGSDVTGTADRQYFMTVDVARGQGGDNSAFVVFDITTMPFTIAARFKNNIISPMLLPSYIQSVGKKYNNAYVLVELNDLGSQVADILHYDLSYENLIKSAYMGMKGQIITETGMGAKKVALGVRTTIPVKKLGCSVLKNLIEQDKLLVSDSDIIDELTTFISDGSSYVADVGHTDDLVMCLVLFAWATRQDFFEGLTDRDVRVEIFNKEIVDIANEILPMFIDDGHNSNSEWDGEDMWFGKNDSTFDKFKPKNWLC